MTEQRAARPTVYTEAKARLEPVSLAFSRLNLAIRRGEDGKAATQDDIQADIKRFWEHAMTTIAAAQHAVVATYSGTAKEDPVDPTGPVSGRRLVRLLRCPSCGGIGELTLGGTAVNLDPCLCEPVAP